MLKIAISGNIAAGKSVVEKFISERGYKVYDTDKIAHELLDNSAVVINAFKNDDIFTNGNIDRKKLSEIVFSNPQKLKLLESILHPMIKDELIKIFDENTDVVFVSVPLLYETGFDKMFDKVLYITADEKIRIKRLISRNNYTEEEAVIRIKSQMPDSIKKDKADYIINNNGDIEYLKSETEKALKFLLN